MATTYLVRLAKRQADMRRELMKLQFKTRFPQTPPPKESWLERKRRERRLKLGLSPEGNGEEETLTRLGLLRKPLNIGQLLGQPTLGPAGQRLPPKPIIGAVSERVTAPFQIPPLKPPSGELKPAPKVAKKATPSDLPGESKLWLDKRSRQKAIDAGKDFYYSTIRGEEVSVKGFPITRPVPTFEFPSLTGGEAERIVIATGQPYKGEMETVNPDTGRFPSDEGKPAGGVSSEARFRERAAQSSNPIVRFANTPTKLFGLTPGDIVGIGLIVQGGISAIRSFTEFSRLPQYKTMTRFAQRQATKGQPIPQNVQQEAKNALKTAFNLHKMGAKEAAEDIMAQFNKAYAGTQTLEKLAKGQRAIAPFKPTLAPKFTPGGTAIPGQTKSLAEIMAGAEMKLGAPARTLNKLATPEETQTLKSVQALASKAGFDLEAVQGIAPNEYWVSLTRSGKPEASDLRFDWLKKLPTKDMPKAQLEKVSEVVELIKGRSGGAKRFYPFKTLADAQRFLTSGDTSGITTSIRLRGQPWTPEQLAETRRVLAEQDAREAPITSQIRALNEKLVAAWAELSNRPKDMPLKQWSALGNKLDKEIDSLRKQITEIGMQRLQPTRVPLATQVKVTPAPEIAEKPPLVAQPSPIWDKQSTTTRVKIIQSVPEEERVKVGLTAADANLPWKSISQRKRTAIITKRIPKAEVTPAPEVTPDIFREGARAKAEVEMPEILAAARQREAITLPKARPMAKDAWKLTLDQYIAKYGRKGQDPGVQRAFFSLNHRNIIQQALSEGKPIPAEVLKDYPDLAKTAGLPRAEPVPEAPAKEAVTAKPQAGKVPPVKKALLPKKPPPAKKPPPPTEPPVIEPQEPVPPSGRPRTLLDLNREAKGMRALSPEDRAAIMDVAKPIKEDELLYKVKPFNEHADNLLQPDTPIRAALRAVPGVKQVAGLWTPAQMQRNNPVAMIGVRKAIFEEIEIGRARLATLNWWHDADELFNFKKIKGKWRATDIKLSASAEPSKPYHATIHDLIEHPENYVFSPEQEKVLQIAQDMQRQILRDAQRVGVDAVELTGDYWRRIVTKAPSDKMFGGKVKTQIASRKGYTRQRAFDFVDDGAKLGFEYETHPLTALQNRLEAGIRTISDQNTRQAMAKLPGVVKPLERLESRYPQTVEGAKTARQARDAGKIAFLREKTVENETALRLAEADYISAMRELFFKKIEAGQPNIGELKLPNGRIAPAELVEEVRKWIDLPEIATSKGSITNATLAVTQLLRSTLTNVDLAAGFIQGQALFYRNNIAWWRSQGNAIVSLIDDPTAYVAKNFDLMDEGMRMGAISIPTEFMFTRQGLASIPTRIPVVGPVMKSFNRAFEWYILTGQTELYRATKSGVIKRVVGEDAEQKSIEALVSLGSAIRKELGTESYALLGVRPTQHTAEQLALFAARFFRALTGIQAQAFTGGEGGREARRAMGALIAGGIALTIAAAYLTEKKMPNMTDPFNPDWMQFQIGKTRFNAFGPFYPFFRTQARVSVYMLRGKPVEAANEIKKFFQGKAGIPFRAIDMTAQFGVKGSYRTYEGKTLPFTPLGVGEAVLGEMAVPISVQEAMRALPQGRPESVVGEVFGLVGREKYPWFPKETFDAYYDIPTDADEAKAQKKPTRTEYRKANPSVEAKLFITGRIDTISTNIAIDAVLKLVRENKIDPDTIPGVKANKGDAAKRRKPRKPTLTDKLVAQLSKLGTTPREPIAPTRPARTPAPVAPAVPGETWLERKRRERGVK